ncbi:acyltransferase [Amylibacter sp.]|nr:acyltransferase [Amylibacter sp.]
MAYSQLDNSITVVRALCVAGIVIFHINEKWLPLGYLGVDLFFVLSGFLITSIIIKQNKKGLFSYTTFYKKRFLRLMPALYASLGLTLVFVSLVGYHNVELVAFIESSISSLLFVSNFYFWQNTGYFVASTGILENIHHWSLSVEEQFYFFWPICLLLFSRFFIISHWFFVALIILLAIVSIYFSVEYPRPAFYLLPTRTWQFLIGSMVAIHAGYLSNKFGKYNKSLFISIIILIIILGDLVPDFDYKIQIYMLIISILLAIFLMAGRTGSLLGILENRPVLWVGIASYSIYLTHQPVLAISRKLLIHPDVQNTAFVVLVIILIFIFSALVHRVEKVFRYRSISGWILISTHTGILVCFVIFASILPNTTIESDFADPAKFDYGCKMKRNDLGCVISPDNLEENSKILLLGNSHARMLLPSFDKFNDNIEVLHPDTLGISLLGGNDDIAIQLDTPEASKIEWLRKICDMADSYNSTVLSYRYIGYLYKSSNVHHFEVSLNKERLRQLNDRLHTLAKCVPHLILVGQVPELNFSPRNVFRRSKKNETIYISRALHDEVSKPVRDMLLNIEQDYENVDLIFPEDFLCNKVSCFASERGIISTKYAFYYDDDHLNIRGSKMLVSKISQLTKGK